MGNNSNEHVARLDKRTLAIADGMSGSDEDVLLSGLAYIRETWDGQEGDDQTPAEAFRTIADWATEIAKVLDEHKED